MENAMIRTPGDGRLLLITLILLAGTWGALGWLDLAQQARAGFDTNGNNTITRIVPGSAAEAAGLKVGDYITHYDAAPLTDASTIARQPRKKAGDTRSVRVEREGKSIEVPVVYRPLSDRELSLSRTSLLIGYSFLLLPFLAWFRRPGEATRVLVVAGTGLSLAFMNGPYLADFSMRSITLTITSLYVMVGIAAMLQFLLVFPHRRPWLDRPYGKKLLYLPALALWLLIAYRALFTPAATGGLNALTKFTAGIVVGAYVLTGLFQVLRNYSRTDQAERKVLALNSMLLGTVLGLVPVTIAQMVAAFSPQASLPGQDFYFVTLALIPITWARSASRP
jgi:hypothetical protein